ncbi:MAG: sugar ABC transporter permease [Oscillospiraceae bacterium]|nr:sugar ABC transporter permease [Oscillospiraceae bacterium]
MKLINKKSLGNKALAIAFFLPFFVLFTLFVLAPVVQSVFYSFTNYDLLKRNDFVGFNNYKQLFLNDEIFLLALKNTMVFACIAGPVSYILSFVMAWILNDMKGRTIFALAFYAPSITSGTAMAVIWTYFFSSDSYGLINNFLMNLGLISSPILWNQSVDLIMPVCIFIQIWMSMGTGFLVFMAGLQNANQELYEAGAIDGIKGRFAELFYITLPQMKPQLLFGAINTIAGSFGVFDVISSFAGFPSPNYAGHTLVAHVYDYAFVRYEMGYASAVSVILFLITFLFGKAVMSLLSSKDE